MAVSKNLGVLFGAVCITTRALLFGAYVKAP